LIFLLLIPFFFYLPLSLFPLVPFIFFLFLFFLNSFILLRILHLFLHFCFLFRPLGDYLLILLSPRVIGLFTPEEELILQVCMVLIGISTRSHIAYLYILLVVR
jgi:hypothetical protein